MLRRGPDRDDASGDTDREERSRWTQAGTVCAVIVIALLLVSGGIIAWSQVSDHHRGAATAADMPPVTPATTGAGPHPRASTSTGTPARESATPTRVTWRQVGLGGLPFSATAGPARVRNGVPSGFAHTRAGSVLAAMQILGRLSWSAQTHASMHGVARACTLPSAQALQALTYDPPSNPSAIPTIAGFQIVTYSPTQAAVNLALRFNGTLRVVPATLRWSAGDWKLAGAPGPLAQTSWAGVSDLTGYVLFSGQPTQEGN